MSSEPEGGAIGGTKADAGDTAARHIGLLGATQLGVGAIIGGDILVLAGVALATAGPSTLVAYLLNGAIALLTALSFAEMASKFPESGGMYAFAKKVLTVETAFAAGWAVWSATIVASALYALGFAYFGIALGNQIWRGLRGVEPPWLDSRSATTALAVGAIAAVSLSLVRQVRRGGRWLNVVKLLAFAMLIAGGFWACGRRTAGDVAASFRPFFAGGLAGLFQAMGYTFTNLHGFDLIAAAGGEVREPARTIPRSMIYSLGISLAVYLPLLFVVVAAGTPAGQAASEAAAREPEAVVTIAAWNFLGPFGYGLVMAAGVLSMLSALHANLFAASRIAHAMARDRTLPAPLRLVSVGRGTPYVAVLITASIAALILLALPNLAAAGAASSLIFLVAFALAHWIAILVRQRSGDRPPLFRAPLFPAVPVVGGLTCLGLAIFQGSVVPAAGLVVLVWLGVGGLLYLGLFAHRARILDASATALDPELVRLRGKSPLILVPIANPQNAPAMVGVAQALAPPDVGRVLLMSVVAARREDTPAESRERIANAQAVLRESLTAAFQLGVVPESLVTIAPEPMAEIARVARTYRCEGMLVGLSDIAEDQRAAASLEVLLGTTDTDIVVLRAPLGWQLSAARRVLVPVGGRGAHEQLLARLLGSLLRTADRRFTFLRVVPKRASAGDRKKARRLLTYLAEGEVGQQAEIEIVASDSPEEEVARRANQSDLVILGVQRLSRRYKLFGRFTRRTAQLTQCPIIVISSRG